VQHEGHVRGFVEAAVHNNGKAGHALVDRHAAELLCQRKTMGISSRRGAKLQAHEALFDSREFADDRF
jgi:hypothetical protein